MSGWQASKQASKQAGYGYFHGHETMNFLKVIGKKGETKILL
jgi:hypothetical protein